MIYRETSTIIDQDMSTLTQQYPNLDNNTNGNSNNLPPLSQLMTNNQKSGSNNTDMSNTNNMSNNGFYQIGNASPRSSFQAQYLQQQQQQQPLVNQANFYTIQPDLSPNMSHFNQIPMVATTTSTSFPTAAAYQASAPIAQQQQQQQQQQLLQAAYPPPPPPQLDSTHLFDKCTCRTENNHIPRPRNAFILFRQKNHQALLDEGNVIRTNPDVSRELGRRWRNLSPEEKNYWNNCAEAEKKRHAEKYPGYKYTPKRNSKKNCPSCKAKQALRNHNLNIQSYLAQYPNSSLYPNQAVQAAVQQQQPQQQQQILYSTQFIPQQQQQQQQLFNDFATHPYYIEQYTGANNNYGQSNLSSLPTTHVQAAPQQQQQQQQSVSPISNASLTSSIPMNQSLSSSTPSLLKQNAATAADHHRSFYSSSVPLKTERGVTTATSPMMAVGNGAPYAQQQLPSINNLSLPPPFTREK